jgi:hypothetical protein
VATAALVVVVAWKLLQSIEQVEVHPQAVKVTLAAMDLVLLAWTDQAVAAVVRMPLELMDPVL